MLACSLAAGIDSGGAAASGARVPLAAHAGGSSAVLAHNSAGQLVGVVSSSGGVSRYTYDDAGNITAVVNAGRPGVAVLSAVPQRARLGEVVTLTGKGFSATPSKNVVTMAGKRATVTASTASTLSFKVPTSTTGEVRVTTPAGSATGPTITALRDAAPKITSFSPASVVPGGTVTINASGLHSSAADNVVRFNGAYGGFVSKTDTSITVEVPEGAASGRISLFTPSGSSTTSTDLRVVPAGVDPATARGPFRLATGVTKALIVPAGRTYLATFPVTGVARYAASVSFSSGTSNDLRVATLGPDNRLLTDTRSLTGRTLWLEPRTIAGEGSGTVVITNKAAASRSVQVKVVRFADRSAGSISLSGTKKSVSTGTPGQRAYVSFKGAPGQRIAVDVGKSPSLTQLQLETPDGDRQAFATAGPFGAFLDPVTLQDSGTYRIYWAPGGGSTGSTWLRAWKVAADVNAGTLSLSGTAKTLKTTRVGQRAYASFAVSTSGATLRIQSSKASTGLGEIRLTKPDGTQVTSRSVTSSLGATISSVALTDAGTYRLYWDPSRTSASSVSVSARRLGDARVDERQRRTAEQVGYVRPRQGGTVPAWTPSAAQLRGADWSMTSPVVMAARPLQVSDKLTAISGVVRDLDGAGVAEVAVEAGGRRATTDGSGRFVLRGVPAGRVVLTLDGSQADHAGRSYGVFRVPVAVSRGRATYLPSVWFPRLDTRYTQKIASPLRRDVVLTTPEIPGLKVKIPKGSVVRDRTGKVVTELGITPLPVNRLPYAMPRDSRVPVYFTVQPGGATIFPRGAQVIYPNYTGEAPGSEVDFISFDPEHGWETYGRGRVATGGHRIQPDHETRVWSLDGFSVGIGALPLPKSGWLLDFIDWLEGDPVEVSSGGLTDAHTDLGVDDVIPISVTRHYWQGDGQARNFGANMRLGYDWYLKKTASEGSHITKATLWLPNGGMVHFSRPSRPWRDIDLAAVNPPPAFAGAKVVDADDGGYLLRLRSGEVWSFPHESRARWMQDKNGNRVHFVRPSPNGDLTRIVSPSGRWISLAYDGSHRVTSARDNSGRVVRYSYDDRGRLSNVTDPAGKVRTYTWDGTSDRIASVTDARGTTYLRVAYEASGRVDRQTLTGGMTYDFDYTADAAGKVTQTRVRQPNGSTTVYDLGPGGRPVKVTEAAGTDKAQATTLVRNSQGRVDAMVDHAGRRTAFGYDALNRMTSVKVRAESSHFARVVERRTYGPFDQPASITDAAGKVTRMSFDSVGNMSSVTDPLGRVTRYTHNSRGLVTSIKSPKGRLTKLGYTHLGFVPASVTDPSGRTLSVFRDALGRPVTTRDSAGNRTRVYYDLLNNPVRRVDPMGRVTQFDYDANGNLTKFTDPLSHTRSWTYDGAERVKTATDPLGKTDTLTYNAAGQLESTTARSGLRTEYAYDQLGRPTTTRYGVTAAGAESTVTRTYDGVGRLESMAQSGAGALSYRYDAYDQVISEDTPQGTVARTYDTVGRPRTVKLDTRTATTYTFNAASELTKLAQGSRATVFSYDADGLLATKSGPGGWKTTHGYDTSGRLTGLTYAHAGKTKGTLSYAYTANGLRRAIGGTFANVVPPTARSGMAYDAADRLTQNAGRALTYDADGNLKSDGVTSYNWNAQGQLTGLSRTGLTASFNYDAAGRRTFRSVNSSTRHWLHDGANPALEKTNGAVTGDLSSAGVDQWLARSSGGVTDTVLTDALGSPVGFGSSDGRVTGKFAYDPFGQRSIAGSLHGSDLGFTGRQVDGTGLMHYRARYYDPALGRFISEDPIGLAGGTNHYAYVNNSPANATDPTGLAGQIVAGCIAGGVLEGVVSWGIQRGSGQKVSWGTVGKNFVIGCATGAIGGIWLRGGFRAVTRGAGDDYARALVNGGRRDGEVVFAGHGEYRYGSGTVVVPEGTSLHVYSPHGSALSQSDGLAIELGGGPTPTGVFGPGDTVPNYTLMPPSGLTVASGSTTVESSTSLSSLLQPGMGACHWAACTLVR